MPRVTVPPNPLVHAFDPPPMVTVCPVVVSCHASENSFTPPAPPAPLPWSVPVKSHDLEGLAMAVRSIVLATVALFSVGSAVVGVSAVSVTALDAAVPTLPVPERQREGRGQ